MKACWAFSLLCGWLGRVFRCDRSSDHSKSEHPGLAVADAPALLHPPAQIDDPPPRDFVHHRIGAGQHDRFQCRHLPFG